MSSRGTSRYRKPKKPSVPQQTPDTLAQIQASTGRVSSGTMIDTIRYHKRPTLKRGDEEEREEGGLSIQSAAAAGVIGTGIKTAVTAGKTVIKLPKTSGKKVRQAGRRGIAPGMSAAAGVDAGPMEQPQQSTSIFTGEVIPGYVKDTDPDSPTYGQEVLDESYKEGPKDLFDWQGYQNILHGLTVPTQQMVQMGKDIAEGVPEEKRTMYESSLDLALMPFLGPLLGQKEYGIGQDEYAAWDYGFADPRNIATGSMVHNIAVGASTLGKGEYWDQVGHEMHLNKARWDRHLAYNIASTTGEIPYFLIGLGEAGLALRAPLKASAMATRYMSGAKGPLRKYLTETGAPERGAEIARGIESAPTRVAQALRSLKYSPPIRIRISSDSPMGNVETYFESVVNPVTGKTEKKLRYKPSEQFEQLELIREGIEGKKGTAVLDYSYRAAEGTPPAAIGQDTRLKNWLYNIRYGGLAAEQTKAARDLASWMPLALPLARQKVGSYIFTELGDLQPIPSAIAQGKQFLGTPTSPTGRTAVPGRYIPVDVGQTMGKETKITQLQETGVYENFLKYMEDYQPVGGAMPKAKAGTGLPRTEQSSAIMKLKDQISKSKKNIKNYESDIRDYEAKKPSGTQRNWKKIESWENQMEQYNRGLQREKRILSEAETLLEKGGFDVPLPGTIEAPGYMAPMAAAQGDQMARNILTAFERQVGTSITDAEKFGRTSTGKAIPFEGKYGEMSDVPWATALQRTNIDLWTEAYRPQDVIKVSQVIAGDRYWRGASKSVYKPGGGPMDIMPGGATRMKAFEALRVASRKKAKTAWVPEGKFVKTQRGYAKDAEGKPLLMTRVRDQSFKVWSNVLKTSDPVNIGPFYTTEGKLIRDFSGKTVYEKITTLPGWATLELKFGKTAVESIRRDVLGTSVKPIEQLKSIIEEEGILAYGVKSSKYGRDIIPGSKTEKDLKRITVEMAKKQRDIDEAQEAVGIGRRGDQLKHMKDVSWHEIMTDGRYNFLRKYFAPELPVAKPDTARVIKLKEKYDRTLKAVKPSTVKTTEAKLRELGNKISDEMYGETSPSADKVRLARDRFSDEVRTGTAGRDWQSKLQQSLPFYAQKKIKRLTEAYAGLEKEKTRILSTTPIVWGKPSVITKLDSDVLSTDVLKEYSMPKGVAIEQKKGYDPGYFDVDLENVGDPTTAPTQRISTFKATKSEIDAYHIKNPLEAGKKKTLGKKVKIPFRKAFRIKEASTERVFVIDQAKIPDITPSMLVGTATPFNREVVKIFAKDYDDVSALEQRVFAESVGLKPVEVKVGKVTKHKDRVYKSKFNIGFYRRRNFWKSSIFEPERIEGKRTFYFHKVEGLDAEKAARFLETDTVVKAGGKATESTKKLDLMLEMRRTLLGGSSEWQLTNKLKLENVNVETYLAKLDELKAQRASKARLADTKEAMWKIKAAILADEKGLDYTGYVSRGETGSNWYALRSGDIYDESMIRNFDIDEKIVDGKTTTTGEIAIEELRRINAEESVQSVKVKELKAQLEELQSLSTREKGVDPTTDEAPVIMEYAKKDGKRIPRLNSKGVQMTNPETGKPMWKTVVKMGDDGEPIRKRTKVKGLKTKPLMQRAIQGLSAQDRMYLQNIIDNKIIAVKNELRNAARYKEKRRIVELQMTKVNPQTGELAVSPAKAKSYIDDYDLLNRTLNEQDQVASVYKTLKEHIEANPNWSEKGIPDELTVVERQLDDAGVKLKLLEDELQDATDYGTPSFDLLQTHVDLLRDNIDVIGRKKDSLASTKKYYAEVRAQQELDETAKFTGELPSKVMNDISDIQVKLSNARGRMRQIHYKRYVIGHQIYDRVSTRKKVDAIELFYSKDFREKHITKVKEWLDADTPEQHAMRIRRAKVETQLENMNIDLYNKGIKRDLHVTDQVRNYAKLNLERKLYSIKKAVDGDPLSSTGEATIAMNELTRRISDLSFETDRAVLLNIAKEGDGGPSIAMQIPAKYTSQIDIDGTKHTLVDPKKFVAEHGDYQDVLGTPTIGPVQYLKPKGPDGKTIKGAKTQKIEPKITDEEHAVKAGNIKGTIHRIDLNKNIADHIENVEVKKLRQSMSKVDDELTEINKTVKVNPKWQQWGNKQTTWQDESTGTTVTLENFPEQSYFTGWAQHHKISAIKREAKTFKRGDYLSIQQKLDRSKAKVASIENRLSIIQKLPDKYKNFSVVPRGVRYIMHENTLKGQIPKNQSRVISITSPDGEEHIIHDGKFYRLPDGYWEGLGSPGQFERKGVVALTPAEVQETFPKPLQNLQQLVKDKNTALGNKLETLEQRIGIEPTYEQKLNAIKSGMPVGYVVADTPIAKIADKIGIRGGTASRFSARYTGTAWTGLTGKVTDRFIDDLSRALERRREVSIGPVKIGIGSDKTRGARIITTDDYEMYVGKYKKGTPGVKKTEAEEKYQMARVLDPDDPTTKVPAGVRRENLYEMTATLPEYPGEIAEGIERLLATQIRDRSVFGERGTIRPEEEPFVAPMGMRDVLDFNQIYPVPGEMTFAGQRIKSTPGGEISIRRHIAYRYLRDVEGHAVKGGGTDTGNFIDAKVSQKYHAMVDNPEYFLAHRDLIQESMRAPTIWERAGEIFGENITAKTEKRRGWINIYNIPIEGERAAEGRLLRGGLGQGGFSVRDVPGFKNFIEKEQRPDPFVLAQLQARIKYAEDAGVTIPKELKFWKTVPPRFSEVDIAIKTINDATIERFGSKFNRQSWVDYNWREQAARDPTWKPQENELKMIEGLQDTLHIQRSKQVKSEIKIKGLEEKLNVKYTDDPLRVNKDENFVPKAGGKGITGTKAERKELQQAYKEYQKTNRYIENVTNKIEGHYSDRKTSHGSYLYSVLREIDPKPIREKDAHGKLTGKITGYEDTPFTNLREKDVVMPGEKSKQEIYRAWLQQKKAQSKKLGLKQQEVFYDPTFKSVEDEDVIIGTSGFRRPDGTWVKPDNPVTESQIRALMEAARKKKLTPEGVKNTERNIKKLQEDLDELNEADPNTKRAHVQHEKDLESVKASLQREVNKLGIHKNIESKSDDFTPIDASDIERGTYTVESGKSVQAVILAGQDQIPVTSPYLVRLPPSPVMLTTATASGYGVPSGIGSLYPSTLGVTPDAVAQEEVIQPVGQPAVPTLKPRPEAMRDIMGVSSFLKDSTKTISSAVTDLTSDAQAKELFPHFNAVGTILHTKERGLIIEKQVQKPKLRLPEPLKQRARQDQPEFVARVTRPPRIRLAPPIIMGWLDPAERAKRQARLRKKKKKKIAWAAPKRWFEGEGYYFKGGQAYTSFTRKEPRKVKRMDVKLGEQKWSESRSASIFDDRPLRGRKTNPYKTPPRKKTKKSQPKRSDLFGPTSTKRKGY